MQLDPDELRTRLEPLIRDNFESRGELGAAISVWQNGKSIVDLCGGFRDMQHEHSWTNDTLVLIWSATKGIGSACLLHVLQENKIHLEQRVDEFWPEFAQGGKENITLAQLLSHQAGLAALDRQVDVLDYPAVIKALEQQTPNWKPGTAHGYHARTFGFLLDELVKRVSGVRLSEYWRKAFAEPLHLDLWIGLPAEQNARVATIYAARGRKPVEPKNRQSGSDFYSDIATPGSFARKVFDSPHGLQSISAMNKPEIRAQPIVSFGGIGNANSLAKFYAMLANNGQMEDRQFFSPQTLGWMTNTLADGVDRVFQIPTAFSAGFMKDSKLAPRRIFGQSMSAFGHPGAGGSHAFVDPKNRIAFAYVMNQMEQSVLPNDKSLKLVDGIYT
jgi:CubicO group peptidase (beta-lactamase class C family)